MMHIQTKRPSLKVVQVSSGVSPSPKPAPSIELVTEDTDITAEVADNDNQQTTTMKTIENPIKQRAAAQIAITAGFGTAAYFLRGTNQIAFWLFLIGAIIAGYTVVQPHQRKNGSVRPSAIQALQAPNPSIAAAVAKPAKAA